MLELLQFVLADGWRFAGALVLLLVIFGGLGAIVREARGRGSDKGARNG